MSALARTIDRVLDPLTHAGAWLVLPLALLLCAQWPLRDLVSAGSRQANDLAQWFFALYVALALRQATRVRGHIAADALAARYAPAARRAIARWGQAVCLLPWSLFVVVAGAAPTWRSLIALEAFPDTFDPLYFVIKCSAWLLALLIALQSIADLFDASEGATQPIGNVLDESGPLGPGAAVAPLDTRHRDHRFGP